MRVWLCVRAFVVAVNRRGQCNAIGDIIIIYVCGIIYFNCKRNKTNQLLMVSSSDSNIIYCTSVVD